MPLNPKDNSMQTLLEVKNLRLTLSKNVQAIRDISFHVHSGESVALVGESGCGKSVTAQSILQLLPSQSLEELSGEILFQGEDLLQKEKRKLRPIRGKDISMIFQDPYASLNPTLTIGLQLTEVLVAHQSLSWKEAKQRAISLLSDVGLKSPRDLVKVYPFSLSGGMRQRVLIAMAVACKPKLLIADEPTTALDVTVQSQILSLLCSLQKEMRMGMLLISHDLGVIAGSCDRVLVMYAGKIIEEGPVDSIFYAPKHPYTQSLLAAVPKINPKEKKELRVIHGSPPDLRNPPKACPFHSRCPYAMEICQKIPPKMERVAIEQITSCWLHHPYAEGVFDDIAP